MTQELATPPLPQLLTPGEAGLVSVVAPCRNERAHIDAFCDSALAQRLPEGWRMELLVADGASDDGTRARLAERAAADARLRLLDNPRRIVSSGLNACLAQARGQVIVRMDIHTRFASDYVAECIAALARSGADNVGGPWVARGQGGWGRAIAAAFQSRWVVGGARSRDAAFEGEVDTVYLGCWPRASLARVGGFDETLVRNQDDEHNLRLRLAGGRIWQSRRIHSSYRPRDSLRQLFEQQMQYGYWRPFVLRKHRQAGSVRQLVPMVFVAAGAFCALLAPVFDLGLKAWAAAYAAYLLAASAQAAHQAGEARLAWRLPWVIAAYHLGYGLGSWRGVWGLWRRRAAPQAATRLTR